MNVDGGLSRHDERSAAIIVCTDKTTNYLGASAIVFDGLVDPTYLEAHACNEALAIAQDLNVPRTALRLYQILRREQLLFMLHCSTRLNIGANSLQF